MLSLSVLLRNAVIFQLRMNRLWTELVFEALAKELSVWRMKFEILRIEFILLYVEFTFSLSKYTLLRMKFTFSRIHSTLLQMKFAFPQSKFIDRLFLIKCLISH